MRETTVFEHVPPEECWQLLAQHHVGRLGLVQGEQPLVLPVNYRTDGNQESIVIQTNDGTKLLEGPQRLVAFEVDSLSEEHHYGWSVLVKGICYDITATRDRRSEYLRSMPVETWLPAPPTQWLEIVPQEITGRRLGPAGG